ncbi:MAG: LysR family transcriptional regulator [Gammaproteobacteria bacterium]|nr:LysR family transcriptional regulator [Gammaproteobacteria bacterium]
MDIANLQTFVTVAETGSFSHASNQLFLTQPAISKRVAALEEELGTSLFDRIGRKVSLTEAGQALLPRARSILLEVEDSRRAISNLSGQVSGKLSIGTSHHIGLHRLPPVLRQFNKDFPEVELDIHFMDSEEACRAVEHGDLEIGIVTLPLTPLNLLQTKEIWPDPLSIVVGQAHPLARQKQLSLEILSEHTAILPATGTYTREVLERAIAHSDKQLKVGLATNYLETIKMMVSVGLGWSVLPDSMLSKEIVKIPLKGIPLHRTLGIVWHAGRTLSNAAEAMMHIVEREKSNKS